MNRHLPTWVLIALMTGAVLTATADRAAAKGIQSNATLVGSAAFPRAKGNARFRWDLQNPSTTTVTVENGPQNGIVSVSLDGAIIGSIPLDALGNGTTTIGGIPAPVVGKMVAVTTDAGAMVASGAFK